MIATVQVYIGRHVAKVAVESSTALLALLLQFEAGLEIVQSRWLGLDRAAVVIGLLGCAEGMLIATARVRRWIAFVLAIPLGLAAVIPLTLATRPGLSTKPLFALFQDYLSAYEHGIGYSHWSYLVWISTILWLGGLWLGWMVLAATNSAKRNGILPLVPAISMVIISVLNATTPRSLWWLTLATIGTALMLLLLIALRTRRQNWWLSRLRAGSLFGPAYLGSGAILIAVVIFFGSLIPPLTTTDYSGSFFAQLRPPAGDNGDGNGGGAVPTIGYRSNVVPGGPLRSDPHPVLTYTTDSGSPTYLAVSYATQLSGGNWYPGDPSDTSYNTLLEGAGNFPIDAGTPASEPLASRAHVSATIAVGADDATGSEVQGLFPGNPLSSNAPGRITGVFFPDDDSFLVVESDQLLVSVNSRNPLVTSGSVSTATVEQLRNAGENYPPYVAGGSAAGIDYTGYLGLGDIPEPQRGQIHALALQMTKGTTNNYDAAAVIEAHLRSDYHYTLNPPSPPSGTWPVTYFLTQSKQGYCQYFAAAMGMLLRSVKIPARLVSGYGPGSHAGGNSYSVTSSDAHTWVEAYFPHYGWIPFEPTPPSDEGNYTPFARGVSPHPTPTASAGSSSSPGNSATPRPTPKPHSHPAAAPSAPNSFPLLPIGTGLTALALLLWLVYRLWWLRPRSLTAAWRRVQYLGRIYGVRQTPADTYFGFAQRLERKGGAGAAGALTAASQIAATLSGAHFARTGIDAKETRRALRAARRLAALLPRALWQRLQTQTRLP